MPNARQKLVVNDPPLRSLSGRNRTRETFPPVRWLLPSPSFGH
jgi:hypothetical protein